MTIKPPKSPKMEVFCVSKCLEKIALQISRRRRHRCHYVSFASKEEIVEEIV